ncbi:unnamed protein product, partial [Rotaria magnacalcarata]
MGPNFYPIYFNTPFRSCFTKPQYDLLEPVPVPNLSVQPKKSLQGRSTTITGAMEGQFAAMRLQPQTKSK